MIVDRPPQRARFATACLVAAGGLLVLALLAPWRRLETVVYFGAIDRIGAELAASSEPGWERIAAVLGLRDDPLDAAVDPGVDTWSLGEAPLLAAAAAAFALTGAALRRWTGTAGPPRDLRTGALVLAAAVLAGSLFAPWSTLGRGGLDAWFTLRFADVAIVAVAVALIFAAVAPRLRVPAAVLAVLAAVAVLLDDPTDDVFPDMSYAWGAAVALAAGVVALIALLRPDRRRTL